MREVRAGSFTPKVTEFFTGLERDNSKDYWTANKAVFENEVKEPMDQVQISDPLEPDLAGADCGRPLS